MTNDRTLPAFIRRDVERAIEDALHPKGMSTHNGVARIGADRLQYLLRMIDKPPNADVLEFLRAFIAGGVNQDFRPWARELYEKLYRHADEPPGECQTIDGKPVHCPTCQCAELEGEPEALVEMRLADDRRIFGNAFYKLVDGRKVRIPPQDVWISPTGELMTGPLSTAEPVLSQNRPGDAK